MKPRIKENLIQASILAGYAFLLFNLLHTGKIVLFINPKLIWMLELAIVLLALIAVARLIPARSSHGQGCRDHDHCGCDHDEHPLITGNRCLAVIFIAPLILGFLMQPRVLGSAVLANSVNVSGPVPFYASAYAGVNQGGAGSLFRVLNPANAPAAASQAASGPANNIDANSQPASGAGAGSSPGSDLEDGGTTGTTDTPSVPASSPAISTAAAGRIVDTDLVQLDVELYENQQQLAGQRFRLTGFVYKDPRLAGNQFVITRFVIVCCLLDTVPIGIIAESEKAADLEPDTWVEAEGVLQMRTTSSSLDNVGPLSNFHGPNTDVPYLVVTSLTKVPAPQDPYLYPPQM